MLPIAVVRDVNANWNTIVPEFTKSLKPCHCVA